MAFPSPALSELYRVGIEEGRRPQRVFSEPALAGRLVIQREPRTLMTTFKGIGMQFEVLLAAHAAGMSVPKPLLVETDAPYLAPVPKRGKRNEPSFVVHTAHMLAELREDNSALAARLREAHGVCEEHRDIAAASLIENWIDETERRCWFLFEAGRR